MKRLLLAALLVLPGAVATAPAHADAVTPSTGTHAYTTTDALVPVLDGPTSTHHTTIDTRLYVPDNAKPANPQPAILMTHGFGLDKTSSEVVSTARFLASHGFVVLTYTAQGFGHSTGCVTLQSRTFDVKDAQQLITKVLETKSYVKKDSHGAVVGMVGGSYGGGITLNLAESDPRIHAIAPGRTWNTLQYALDPNNYVAPGDPTGFTHTLNEQGVFKLEWTSIFFASGNANPIGGLPPNGQEAGSCPQEKLAGGEAPDVACPGFNLPVCETYTKIAALGDSDITDRALLADASGATGIIKLKVPTLLVQGQSDTLFNENDAAATYLALKRQGTPVQLIWNSGGHGGYNSKPGECESYDGTDRLPAVLDACYLSLRQLTFFDHWLKGLPDHSPGFSYFADWLPYKGSGPTNQYLDAPTFPLPVTAPYQLSGSGDLVQTGAVAGTATIVNPLGGEPAAYTETSEFTGPDGSPSLASVPPTEVQGQHADFLTPPFREATALVGIPDLKVTLSHVAPTDLVLFAKAYDVAPDGTATLIHRLISPARIPTAALSKPVHIKLLGFAHQFGKGHRFRLTLATTDQTSYNNKVADVITVHTGPTTALTLPLSIPVVDGAPARPVRPAPAAPVSPVGPSLPTTGTSMTLPLLAFVLLTAVAVRRRHHGRTRTSNT